MIWASTVGPLCLWPQNQCERPVWALAGVHCGPIIAKRFQGEVLRLLPLVLSFFPPHTAPLSCWSCSVGIGDSSGHLLELSLASRGKNQPSFWRSLLVRIEWNCPFRICDADPPLSRSIKLYMLNGRSFIRFFFLVISWWQCLRRVAGPFSCHFVVVQFPQNVQEHFPIGIFIYFIQPRVFLLLLPLFLFGNLHV